MGFKIVVSNKVFKQCCMLDYMEQLHSGAKWLFRLRAYSVLLFFAIFLSVFSSGFLVAFITDFSSVILTSIIFVLIFMFVFGEIYARLAYPRWKYEFTPTELKIEKGIIWKIYKSIPYQRVQNVEIHRGIIARLLGFSSLNIHTAGYSGYGGRQGRGMGAEGSIPAIGPQAAEKIREFLMKKIGKRSGM
jgi:membrane protein YdbS with pleckstrin-like domain